MATVSDGIRVKVAKLGNTVRELFLPVNSTVRTAVEQSGFSASGLETKRNGRVVEGGDYLSNDDFLTLVPKTIKGGN